MAELVFFSSFLKEQKWNNMQIFCGLGIRREISLNVKLRANQTELEPVRPDKKKFCPVPPLH
jgi:hypothetical protein